MCSINKNPLDGVLYGAERMAITVAIGAWLDFIGEQP